MKGVVNASAPRDVELEAHFGTAAADVLTCLRLLLRRGSVLLRQVLAHVLATRTHLRVEFEGQKVHRGTDVRLYPGERLLQCAQAHRAPGA